jgi:hypothetical protein
MLTDHITQALKTRLPEVPFVFSCPPDPTASLFGPCEELSPLQICDDDDEATIYLGTISHGHFGCYEEGITEDERHQLIAEDVADFVRDLLSNRIVAMSTLGGRVGGWRRLSADEVSPSPSVLKRQYVWSHPIQ